ncbi:DUF1240 domain-containing protein [Xenorhabdus sp. BG5]|uniref:DUF1240 domain-containing protein n=1 Tax=Xenorhabdus sp. BG5 TaxID=2782014 RepID=UPI0030D74DEF
MDNKNRIIVIISSVSFILMSFLLYFFIFDDIVSFIKMKDEIIFSWKLFLFFFASPLLLYMCVCTFYYSVASKPMKINNKIMKVLTINFFVFLALSFPVSWYLDIKLKGEGYTVCERLSVGSPNKYVKYPKTCR